MISGCYIFLVNDTTFLACLDTIYRQVFPGLGLWIFFVAQKKTKMVINIKVFISLFKL
jgi:hypothetical protein